jgi:hypothetical protein
MLSFSESLKEACRILEHAVLSSVFNYGLPSYRLLGYAVLWFGIGVGILMFPTALESRQEESITPATIVSAIQAAGQATPAPRPPVYSRPLRPLAAAGTLLSSIIPGKQAALFTECQPSHSSKLLRLEFSRWIAGISLLIYSCVTIALVGLSGLTKRRT